MHSTTVRVGDTHQFWSDFPTGRNRFSSAGMPFLILSAVLWNLKSNKILHFTHYRSTDSKRKYEPITTKNGVQMKIENGDPIRWSSERQKRMHFCVKRRMTFLKRVPLGMKVSDTGQLNRFHARFESVKLQIQRCGRATILN